MSSFDFGTVDVIGGFSPADEGSGVESRAAVRCL